MINNIADIYDLSEEKLLTLERMGKKSAQNILSEIENSKKLPLERVIYGFREFAWSASVLRNFWPKHFGSMDELLKPPKKSCNR